MITGNSDDILYVYLKGRKINQIVMFYFHLNLSRLLKKILSEKLKYIYFGFNQSN